MASRLFRQQLERVGLYAHDSRTIATTLLRSIRAKPVAGVDDLAARTKQVLLETSRQANVASIKILNGEKELNLLRYHGVTKYLQMAWQRRSRVSSSIADGGGAADTSDGRTARVAFMITSQNRQDLNKLGYSTEDIRQLTPADALLLLENRAEKKDSVTETLQLLKHDTENVKTSSAQQQSNIIEDPGDDSMDDQVMVSVTPQEATAAHAKSDVASALLSPHQGHQATELDEDGDCWFEVVERPPSASAETGPGRPAKEHVIALFSSRREADECVQVKLGLRKNASCDEDRYFVRKRRSIDR